jgi:hypothetical protein
MEDALIQKNVDICRERVKWSCDKANERTSDYSKFLAGLASIIFGLSPLIKINRAALSVKFVFTTSLFLLIICLILGAVHIWLERHHFDVWADKYKKIFDKWNATSVGEISVEAAINFENGVYVGSKIESPIWPLICQSILLLLGFIGLSVIICVGIYQ